MPEAVEYYLQSTGCGLSTPNCFKAIVLLLTHVHSSTPPPPQKEMCACATHTQLTSIHRPET